jgi:hypothetical protein
MEDTYLMKLQHPQNKVPGDFPRHIVTHELHVAFNMQCIYDYYKKHVIQNHKNAYIYKTGTGKATHRKYKRLTFGGSQASNLQVSKLLF